MEIVVRATVVFFLLWLLLRALGKRELSEMTAFELILLVTIGDIVQQAITEEDMSVTGGMLAAGTIMFWVLAFSYLSFRVRRAGPVIEGIPVVVVRDGELVHEALHLERIGSAEVMGAAREQGIRELREIQVGILEGDGRFSFLRAPGGEASEQPDRHRGA